MPDREHSMHRTPAAPIAAARTAAGPLATRDPAAAPWLSLGPASRMLGVDPDTLRRWADEGRVQAWTTPGGHRRFERTGLERLAADRRSDRPRALASMGASRERMGRVYQRHYAADEAGHGALPETADPARDAHRAAGRELIGVLLGFLDHPASDAPGRAALEAQAGLIVDAQAARLAGARTSLTEAVARFITARQPFLAEIAGLGRRRALDAAPLASLYEDASGLLDRLLLRFIDAHQQAWA